MSRPLPGRAGHKTLIGMVHLPPVLERGVALEGVEAAAVRDAVALAEAGFDAIAIENFGDRPFYPDQVPPHTVAGMTRVAVAVRAALEPGFPLGLNVLRNDLRAALAIAAAVDARFARVNVHSGAAVTDQGLIQGKAHETVRYRDLVAPGCAIFADVRVKHAAPLAERPLAEEVREVAGRGGADAVIVSGARTGGATDPERLRLVKAASDVPVLVGSGTTPEAFGALAPHADGFIVGTWTKIDGDVDAPVDLARARRVVAALRAWESCRH